MEYVNSLISWTKYPKSWIICSENILVWCLRYLVHCLIKKIATKAFSPTWEFFVVYRFTWKKPLKLCFYSLMKLRKQIASLSWLLLWFIFSDSPAANNDRSDEVRNNWWFHNRYEIFLLLFYWYFNYICTNVKIDISFLFISWELYNLTNDINFNKYVVMDLIQMI